MKIRVLKHLLNIYIFPNAVICLDIRFEQYSVIFSAKAVKDISYSINILLTLITYAHA